VLEDFSSVPSVECRNVGDGRQQPADEKSEKHETTGTSVEPVSLLEDDGVGDEEEIETAIDERHVDGDGGQHGFEEQDGEGFHHDILEHRARGFLPPLEWSPIAVVPRLLSQDLGLLYQQNRGVGFGDREEYCAIGEHREISDGSAKRIGVVMDAPRRPQKAAKKHRTQ